MYVCMYVCMNTCSFTYVCLHMYIYVFTDHSYRADVT